jgi:hypothetical protein
MQIPAIKTAAIVRDLLEAAWPGLAQIKLNSPHIADTPYHFQENCLITIMFIGLFKILMAVCMLCSA